MGNRRCIVAILFVAAGCGGGSSPAPRTPAPPPAPAAEPNLPEPLLAALAGHTLYIEDFSSMMLFADERLAAQQIIATWARTNGITVLDPATTEAAIGKAGRGIDPDVDVACGPSLDRALAIERWIRADGHIRADVYCESQCTLQVQFRLDAKGTEFYAAQFDTAQPWRAELAYRLSTVVDNGGHGMHGHANNPVAIHGIERGANDLIADRDADVELADGAAIANQCGATGLDLTLLVDPSAGSPARCEPYADARLVTEHDPAILACACERVATRVSAKRRQVVHLPAPAVAPDKVTTKSGKVVTAQLIGGNEYRTFGVAWFVPGQLDLHVPHCFANRTALDDGHEVKATILFAKDGTVIGANLADFEGLLQPGEAECLDTAIKALRTPCPVEDHPVGTARIYWRVADP